LPYSSGLAAPCERKAVVNKREGLEDGSDTSLGLDSAGRDPVVLPNQVGAVWHHSTKVWERRWKAVGWIGWQSAKKLNPNRSPLANLPLNLNRKAPQIIQ
jgi:hypothetical protein